MIGRVPMMPPTFAPSYPAGAYRVPPVAAQPAPHYLAQPQAAPPSPAFVQQPHRPRPVVRAQEPDEARPAPAPAPEPPARVSLPSPESLGIAAAGTTSAEALDWTAAHRHLERLGATCFQLERLPQGGCRITCLLPTDQPSRLHRIESRADKEGDALRLVLSKADEWTRAATLSRTTGKPAATP